MKLNTQGNEIVTAIKAGIAAGGVDEWDSPEFEAARKASEGYVWEFAGWADTLACIERHGALGGDSLAIRYEDVRGCGMREHVADFRATWPNGNDPDGETQVAIYVHGSDDTGYVLVLDDNECGGSHDEAGTTVYETLKAATSAATEYAEDHDE
jgi:hypothetical protein